jgi:hypothetical protein
MKSKKICWNVRRSGFARLAEITTFLNIKMKELNWYLNKPTPSYTGYSGLFDDDWVYKDGMENALLDRLQQKLGKSKEQVLKIVSDLVENEPSRKPS